MLRCVRVHCDDSSYSCRYPMVSYIVNMNFYLIGPWDCQWCCTLSKSDISNVRNSSSGGNITMNPTTPDAWKIGAGGAPPFNTSVQDGGNGDQAGMGYTGRPVEYEGDNDNVALVPDEMPSRNPSALSTSFREATYPPTSHDQGILASISSSSLLLFTFSLFSSSSSPLFVLFFCF